MPRVRVKNNIACSELRFDEVFEIVAVEVTFSDRKCTWEFVGIYTATNEDLGCVHTNRVEWVQSSPVRL